MAKSPNWSREEKDLLFSLWKSSSNIREGVREFCKRNPHRSRAAATNTLFRMRQEEGIPKKPKKVPPPKNSDEVEWYAGLCLEMQSVCWEKDLSFRKELGSLIIDWLARQGSPHDQTQDCDRLFLPQRPQPEGGL